MTLEEGLQRLKERHEALTESVELLRASIEETRRTVESMAAENRERDRRIMEIMEGIARLLHVAEIHEHRIERLEGEH